MGNRTVIMLTDEYQAVATGPAVITVNTIPRGMNLSVNDVASDLAAMVTVPRAGDQFSQTDVKTTYAKGQGVEIIVDQE